MTLYKHQQDLVNKYKDSSIIPIFADAGTGKSATTLAIISHKYAISPAMRVLIIAPNNVDIQWAREQIPLFLNVPTALIVWYKRGAYKIFFDNTLQKNKVIPLQHINIDEADIVVTNIDQFSRTSTLAKYTTRPFNGIVLDESTTIKNIKSARTKALLTTWNVVKKRGNTILSNTVKTDFRVILTGTPTTNSPLDVYTQMAFLDPHFWGMGWYEFSAHYGLFSQAIINNRTVKIPLSQEVFNSVKKMNFATAQNMFGITPDTYAYIQETPCYTGAYRHIDELKEKLQEVASFVRITDVVDMPKQQYIQRRFELSKEQKQLIKEFNAELSVSWLGVEVTATSKLVARLRLQQIAIGFANGAPIPPPNLTPDEADKYTMLGNDSVVIPNDRIKLLLNDLEEISTPCIVFTNFMAEADFVFTEVKKAFPNKIVALATGWYTTPNAIEYFKEDKIDVLVANIKVLAKGFNLQNAYYTLYYSNTSSAEDRIQSEARTWRLGQQHTVFYYDYIAEGSVDEDIMKAQRQRISLLDYITRGE